MHKLERWFVMGLVALIALMILLVVIGPRLEQEKPSSGPLVAPGQTETMTARVIEVLEEGVVDSGFAGDQRYQRLLLRVLTGSLADKEVVVEEGAVNIVGQERLFRPGDRVYLERAIGPQGDRLYITDYVRTGSLFWIALFFVGLVVLVGRGRGLRALAGTLFSVLVILTFILPQIRAGRDPVTVCVLGSILLLTVSTYLVYGWKPKAHAALAGMALSLVLTAFLAWLFVGWSRLSGFGSEEGAYLLMELGPGVSLRGLVLGGIIIGSLGVLDDICIGQASAIFELVNANRDLGWRDLFHRSLNIGRDHIASLVNTLLLAYVGASMPLMMVFTIYQEPLLRRLNREPVAEEIVRTLVGSMGLILAVPITSVIASLLARWMVRRESVGAGLAENAP
jgi:uncharacterized membrane protein